MKKLIRKINYCLLALIFLLLSSCSTTRVSHDGPPPFYVDETKVADAIPRAEPLAKYGNMPHYKVLGKHYYTLKSSHRYEATGIASWYGTQFDHHKTSSGEIYSMVQMTAAHKTLPLPTYVEVTNLENNRRIIVKVNDRGPFVSNRLIDLSYVAAKKLHMLGHGTAPVRIRALDPWYRAPRLFFARNRPAENPTKSFYRTSLPTNDSNFVYLQVGAFRNKINAIKFRERLLTLVDTPIKILSPDYQTGLYRVRVGPIDDMQLAENIRTRLKNVGIAASRIG